MPNLNEYIATLSPTSQKRIHRLANELIAAEMTLRELRKARKLTQINLAKQMNVSQEQVSRMEKRGDLLLSTLSKTVEAMGGELKLIATFPDHKAVRIRGFSEDVPAPELLSPNRRSRPAATAR